MQIWQNAETTNRLGLNLNITSLVTGLKCWHLMYLPTTNMIPIAQVIQVYIMCPITLTLDVYYLTLMCSWRGWRRG